MSATATVPVFRFDAEGHRYWYGDRELLSVTRVLDLAGLTDPTHWSEAAAERGTHVHLACEYADRGTLDETTLDPALMGYVAAWRAYRSVTGYQWDAHGIERRLCAPDLGLAGTIDRLVTKPGHGPARIVDIKSGAPAPSHALQLAGYDLLVRDNALVADMTPITLECVYLDRDGGFTTQTWTDRAEHRRLFNAARLVAQWRVQHGLV